MLLLRTTSLKSSRKKVRMPCVGRVGRGVLSPRHSCYPLKIQYYLPRIWRDNIRAIAALPVVFLGARARIPQCVYCRKIGVQVDTRCSAWDGGSTTARLITLNVNCHKRREEKQCCYSFKYPDTAEWCHANTCRQKKWPGVEHPYAPPLYSTLLAVLHSFWKERDREILLN